MLDQTRAARARMLDLLPRGASRGSRSSARSARLIHYDVGPARAFLGEAEKLTMCGLGPASRVKLNFA